MHEVWLRCLDELGHAPGPHGEHVAHMIAKPSHRIVLPVSSVENSRTPDRVVVHREGGQHMGLVTAGGKSAHEIAHIALRAPRRQVHAVGADEEYPHPREG